MNSFSNILKYLRNRAGLSQLELAKKLGMSKSAISMYELGRRQPDLETMEIIADFFNVDMNFLYGKTDESDDGYYYDEQTAQLAQEIYDNKELGMLMSASRKMHPDDLRNLTKLVESLVRKESGQSDS